jgi:probable HAF family extracellular repeat protein
VKTNPLPHVTRSPQLGVCLPLLLLVLIGCGETTEPALVAAIQVVSPGTEIVVGDTLRLSAALTDQRGGVLVGRAVTWSSSDTTRARVSSSGLVTGIAPGEVTITAASGGTNGAASLAVVHRLPRYSVTFLGTLGSDDGVATGINNRGQVVGRLERSVGTRAFLWANGQMQDLGTLYGWNSSAVAINDTGEVIGDLVGPEFRCRRSFRWSDGSMRDLNPSTYTGACTLDHWYRVRDINDRGEIVGNGTPGGGFGFLWRDGAFVPLASPRGPATAAGINNRSEVTLFDPTDSWVWRDGVNTLVNTGARSTEALGINDSSTVVGALNSAQHLGGWRLFRWTDGTTRRMDGEAMAIAPAQPVRINNRGQVVASLGPWNDWRPAILVGDSLHRLDHLLLDTAWRITHATDLNDTGQIVGRGVNDATGAAGPVLLTPQSP